MAHSSNTSSASRRRGRYTRRVPERAASLTPVRVALLRALGDLGLASLPQLALIAAPSEASARRHLRVLFDHGLVDVLPAPRTAFVPPGERDNPSLLFGSAPNLYILTRAGERLLQDVDGTPPRRRAVRGLPNSLFLAHTLGVTDFRIYLERAIRGHRDWELRDWRDGKDAVLDFKCPTPPREVRPDAFFVLGLGERVLVGLVEVDTGTERGTTRWKEKLAAYRVLYSGGQLKLLTGYANARVLVITPDARRRDHLTKFVSEHGSPELAARFWLAERVVLQHPDLANAGWRTANEIELQALVPAARLGGATR